MSMKTDKKKLELWQRRLSVNEAAFAGELAKMGEREELYAGSARIKPIAREDVPDEAPHVRNVVNELIEAQVSSSIPQPKVSARRREDEPQAKLIEDMLRDELDRMSFEELNDQQERTVPIQGGGAFLIEWDSTQRTHTTAGEVAVSLLHPKQMIPQAGVYSGVEDMDYIILKIPQTKAYIKRRYGVDVLDETESEPEVKGEAEGAAEDMVTQYVGYYRNSRGGIGLYSWVNDTQLERGTVATDWSPSPDDKADADKVVTSVNGGTGDVVIGGVNLYAVSKEYPRYIYDDSGVHDDDPNVNHNRNRISDYIPVSPSKQITVREWVTVPKRDSAVGYVGAWTSAAWFDSEKRIISVDSYSTPCFIALSVVL